MLRIIQNRKIFFVAAGILVGLSLAASLVWGLKPGLDFTGGSLMEIEFSGGRPAADEVAAAARKSAGTEELFVQALGDSGLVLRMPSLDESAHQALLADLKKTFETEEGAKIDEKRFESIGPLIGAELRKKTMYAVVGAILAIVLYITYAFRQISYPVASWKYGVCTIVALAHDVAIPTGVFAVLGRYLDVEVGAWMVTALLTILGFSVHDTIVVFDRIRERLSYRARESFEETVNRSVNETLARSINTSLTVLLVLFAAYFFGGESIKNFVLTLIIGITAGTYSSIFVASPLLIHWEKETN